MTFLIFTNTKYKMLKALQSWLHFVTITSITPTCKHSYLWVCRINGTEDTLYLTRAYFRILVYFTKPFAFFKQEMFKKTDLRDIQIKFF